MMQLPRAVAEVKVIKASLDRLMQVTSESKPVNYRVRGLKKDWIIIFFKC